MTGLIAIDESCDLGQEGSRYFLMAAIITRRPRNLLSAYKKIPTRGGGRTKFYNATEKERIDVLKEVALSDIDIVYVCVDKSDHTCFIERGNNLYSSVLDELFKLSFETYPLKDLNIFIDESGFIKAKSLRIKACGIGAPFEKNIKDVKKTPSNKCIKIVDYVVGAIRMKYENEKDELYSILKDKISRAREPLRPR